MKTLANEELDTRHSPKELKALAARLVSARDFVWLSGMKAMCEAADGSLVPCGRLGDLYPVKEYEDSQGAPQAAVLLLQGALFPDLTDLSTQLLLLSLLGSICGFEAVAKQLSHVTHSQNACFCGVVFDSEVEAVVAAFEELDNPQEKNTLGFFDIGEDFH
tara:strand:+ start:766 stop:1248 length:483 start_codon:yes stop_codon:yes gene_type:complete